MIKTTSPMQNEQEAMAAFWKKASANPLVVTVGDGQYIPTSRHTGLGPGHPLLDGLCLNCGSDEKTCECKEPDIQNPRSNRTL